MTKNGVEIFLEKMRAEKGITEIVINGPAGTFVERGGLFSQLNISFTPTDIDAYVQSVASFNQKKFDKEHPILDGNLPDGSRVNLIGPPFTQAHTAITIRRYIPYLTSFDKNPELFGLTNPWVEFLRALVWSRMNILVSGGTGCGKTTLLNLLIQEIHPQERVITIEDTLELQVPSPNQVRLESRNLTGMALSVADAQKSLRNLVKNTLRMRPDRIIIGEVRGPEAFELLQAMNTGHSGCLTSLHANSSVEALSRFETLIMMGSADMPLKAIRKQVSQNVHYVVHLSKTRQGERCIQEILEVTDLQGDIISTQVLAKNQGGTLKGTGLTPKFMATLNERANLERDFFKKAI